MLRIIQNTGGAKAYFSTADYYAEGQELVGMWHGEGARRLGLSGEIQNEAWDALCDNLHPSSGKLLTQRQKDLRRIGYDFNFHVPKSLSLLYSLTKDERILGAFRESVDETMRDMEPEMKTRVRTSGRNEDRTTANMVWGEFIHFTSRPVNGIPDPHLHAHCFVFNSTFDDKEQRWKAGQFAGLKRDAPYFEAAFHSRLTTKIGNIGIKVEQTRKGWEIVGIGKATLDKFSRRTAQIEEKARELGLTDNYKKDELGAKTRERKAKNLSFDELQEEWRSRLTPDEQDTLARAIHEIGGKRVAEDYQGIREAVTLALDHCFERKSVVPERQLIAEALKRAVGKGTLASIEREFKSRKLLIGERDGRRMATTPTVLAEEKRMIDFARNGRGSCSRLGNGTHLFKRDWLNKGQRMAVKHILGSRDRVTLVRGAAGVGKTSMMQEAVEAIEANGTKVFTFAPSADASRGTLRKEGFQNADTIARLLLDTDMQQKIQGQVIWVDEAGLLSSKTTGQLFDLARKLDARVILSGDRFQHGSVERGAPLRLLETEAGLISAEIKDIQRQKGSYKQAIEALAEHRIVDGFGQLDNLGWIREITDADRYKSLAGDYVATVAAGKSALVVSPTHFEGQKITDQIRSELKQNGRIGKKEREFSILTNVNFTQAERSEKVNYSPGDVLVFHQNAKGYPKGQRVIVGEEQLPLDQAERFQTFHAGSLPIASGDILRITQGGKTADGKHRLDNGTLVTVKRFNGAGDIVLTNGWIVSKDFGHLSHGYVVTSHASQGKTVDRVFIGQSSHSLPASSREQFYVSTSRAREQATIYTDDKTALLDAVRHSDERLTATEFFSELEQRQRVVGLQRMQQADGQAPLERERQELAYER